MQHTFKRGDKVVSDGPYGTITGRVLRTYSAREIAAHATTHGVEAAARLPEWLPCEMRDAAGTMQLAFHYSSLRRI